MTIRNGGYDEGYSACPCFWGTEPSSLVERFVQDVNVAGSLVLDLGCGEGKNAFFLADLGARVIATDISMFAIANARRFRPLKHPRVSLILGDATRIVFRAALFDVVIAYGLLHCLPTPDEVARVINWMKASTVLGGYNIVCAFNNGHHDLAAHPSFSPTLLGHRDYLAFYHDWEVVTSSDSILREKHPHNLIEHTHTLTRMISRRVDA